MALILSLFSLTGCGGGWGELKPEIGSLGNLTVKVGATASFSTEATGTGPITYQWYRNSVAIAGATSNSYSFVTKASDDGAVFMVGATNAGGTATSSGTLTVLTPPTITTQPVSQSIPVQQTATFTVNGGLP